MSQIWTPSWRTPSKSILNGKVTTGAQSSQGANWKFGFPVWGLLSAMGLPLRRLRFWLVEAQTLRAETIQGVWEAGLDHQGGHLAWSTQRDVGLQGEWPACYSRVCSRGWGSRRVKLPWNSGVISTLAPGARRPPSCGSPPRTRPWSTSCGGGTSGHLSWPSCSSFCCSSWGSSSTPSRYDGCRRGQGGLTKVLGVPPGLCGWPTSVLTEMVPVHVAAKSHAGPWGTTWWTMMGQKESLCFWSLLQTHCKVLTSLCPCFKPCLTTLRLIDCFQRGSSSWCRRCCRAGGKIPDKHAASLAMQPFYRAEQWQKPHRSVIV